MFYAKSGLVPLVGVAVTPASEFADAVTTALTGAGGSDIKIGTPTDIELADGTAAQEAKVRMVASGYEAEAYALEVTKGDESIVVVVVTVPYIIPYDEALFPEIAQTLRLSE